MAYVAAVVLARPDWGAAGRGLVVPSTPMSREALVASRDGRHHPGPVGAGVHPVYAADKGLRVSELRYERLDVVVGAVLTGVIGTLVVVACAATLHVHGIHVDDAGDAARTLEPLAGGAARLLFGVGFVGAALLAAAESRCRTRTPCARPQDGPPTRSPRLRDSTSPSPASWRFAAGLVLVPGAPLITILYLTQALNAVLLLGLLPFMGRLGRDPEVLGALHLTRPGVAVCAVIIAAVGVACAVLLGLSLGIG